MTSRHGAYVYGPVPSRRLGRSLGIDIVPFKTCTYDCVYCQLGRTTLKTTERREYIPVGEALAEFEKAVAGGVSPDYVTLAGSGEPTLHSRLGELIAGVRRRAPFPVAVLTNGSLLSEPLVRDALMDADLVIPSLDAGDAALFEHVNRPCPGMDFEGMVEGLVEFRRAFRGRLWLEVFLLGGVTGISVEVDKISRLVRRISPDKVQLNSVSRPPAEEYASAVPPGKLAMFAGMFEPRAEVIDERSVAHSSVEAGCSGLGEVLSMLRRRPSRIEDLGAGLGIPCSDALKHVEALVARGQAVMERMHGTPYYRGVPGAGPGRKRGS